MNLALVWVALIAGLPADGDTPPAANAYEAARAQAGRSPDDQVRLALWCEAHGLPAERLKHLALAVLADPTHATARGLMGLVARDGRWQRPEVVADKLKADEAMASTLHEYDARRQKAAYTADGQWTLGLWAEEHGLKEQARAHFTAVIRLDPTREIAWKRLGFKKHDGRWVTEPQLAAENLERDAQKKASQHWKVALEKYRSMLDQPSKREEALSALAAITDPRAVPSIARVFVTDKTDKPADQALAVQLLGQVEGPTASKTLAAMAVFARTADVRRLAVETLRQRDPREFLGLWVSLIRDPVKFEVKKVGGPGSPGTLFIEGQKANLKRTYSPPAAPDTSNMANARLSYDRNGLPVLTQAVGQAQVEVVWIPDFVWNNASVFNTNNSNQVSSLVNQIAHGGNLHKPAPQTTTAGSGSFVYYPYVRTENGLVPITRELAADTRGLIREIDIRVPIGQMQLEAQRSAETAQQQLAADVAAIEKTNDATRRANEPALFALKAVTGQDMGDDSLAWNRWWIDQQGSVLNLVGSTDKPTIVEEVPLNYTPQTTPQVANGSIYRQHSACFAAGTTVRTIDGSRAIETIKAGDLVLVQDTRTGALSYQAVIAPIHNPPSPTLQINLGEETIVATGIHRFWKPGKGWTMARDLKPGDAIRTLGGVLTVASIQDDKTQPVFNLEVAETRSFFVGKAGTLVHDNSLVEPTVNPFDAVASVK